MTALRFTLGLTGAVLLPIGAAGVVLPILPGTPLLILSAFCFARSFPGLERKLLDHTQIGPPIRAWRERGAIPRPAKALACSALSVSILAIAATPSPLPLKAALTAGLMLVIAWLLTRPER